MIKSYKNQSKTANLIVFIAGAISYIGKDGLSTIIPPEYANLIPIIILIAGYITVQSTENTRVEVAEQIIEEKYQDTNPATDMAGDANDQ